MNSKNQRINFQNKCCNVNYISIKLTNFSPWLSKLINILKTWNKTKLNYEFGRNVIKMTTTYMSLFINFSVFKNEFCVDNFQRHNVKFSFKLNVIEAAGYSREIFYENVLNLMINNQITSPFGFITLMLFVYLTLNWLTINYVTCYLERSCKYSCGCSPPPNFLLI